MIAHPRQMYELRWVAMAGERDDFCAHWKRVACRPAPFLEAVDAVVRPERRCARQCVCQPRLVVWEGVMGSSSGLLQSEFRLHIRSIACAQTPYTPIIGARVRGIDALQNREWIVAAKQFVQRTCDDQVEIENDDPVASFNPLLRLPIRIERSETSETALYFGEVKILWTWSPDVEASLLLHMTPYARAQPIDIVRSVFVAPDPRPDMDQRLAQIAAGWISEIMDV